MKRFRLILATTCVVLGATTFILWPKGGSVTRLPQEFFDSAAPTPAGLVADHECNSCHSDICQAYLASGMNCSWNSWKDARPIEPREEGSGPVLTLNGLSYQALVKAGRLYQREFQVVNGAEVELNRREAVYVVGSGLKGRTYLASEHGRLTVLPLSWYSNKKAWDFSPGYRENNARFSRPITPECVACHNGFMAERPGSFNAYVEPFPTGLGCQRCHGPGGGHVAFHRDGIGEADPLPKFRSLPVARQQDVCLQCHLLGDSFAPPSSGRNSGTSPHESFRPGDKLAEMRVDFFRLEKPTFAAVGHGPRSMASKCYQASEGKMTCVHCHDAHRPAAALTRADYNQKCMDCHRKTPCDRPLPAGENQRSATVSSATCRAEKPTTSRMRLRRSIGFTSRAKSYPHRLQHR